MNEMTRAGVDLAKRIIQVHAMDACGRVVDAKALAADKFAAWCAQLPPGCLLAAWWLWRLAAVRIPAELQRRQDATRTRHQTRRRPPAHAADPGRQVGRHDGPQTQRQDLAMAGATRRCVTQVRPVASKLDQPCAAPLMATAASEWRPVERLLSGPAPTPG